MSLVSPEIAFRWKRFKQMKLSYYSLLLFLAIFLFTLPAELLFNDHPLILRFEGKTYFPALKTYTFGDLGRDSTLPIQNYRSGSFERFLQGQDYWVEPSLIFGDDNETIAPSELKDVDMSVHAVFPPTAENVDKWMLFPPFRHSYKSYYRSKKLAQQNLASPLSKKDPQTGETLVGATVDGYYLGTEGVGKCVLARLIYGIRISVLFGVCLAFSGTVIGCILGALQGYFGGLIDLFGQRLTEIWGGIPQLFLLIILGSIFSRMEGLTDNYRYLLLFGILNLFAWMGMASHMRAMFLRARNLDYVKAAKALGVSNFQIMKRHILPNSLVPIVTFVPFAVTSGIYSLVSLDYLGFGVRYPAPSLGELLNQGKENLQAWWILIPTFLALVVMLSLLTFIGEGVRDAFDPRRKG